GFKTLIGGVIPGAAGEIVGQALHVRDFFFVVVRVLIVLAVTKIFHEAGWRIAEVQRNGIGFGLLHVFVNCAESSVEGIGFWCEGRGFWWEGKVDDGWGEDKIALRWAEEVEGFFCG